MILKNEVIRLGLKGISVASSGLHAYPGQPPDSKMVAFLREKGIPVDNHEARQLEKTLLDWADIILVMEKAHAEVIRRRWPEVEERVEHLGSFVSEGLEADDIVDPYGRSPYHYRVAQSQIFLAIRSLIERKLKNS